VPRSLSEALLLACARPAAVQEPSPEIADLAHNPNLRWPPTATLARWQGIAPRLARSLVVSGVAAEIPHHVGEQLQSQYFATMARSLVLHRELERVVDELRRHRIDVMLLKGAALLPLVHHDPGVRIMDDLDLLVHREDLALADRVIRNLGYVASASAPVALTLPTADGRNPLPHHLAALVRTDGGVTIELHHKLGDSYTPLDFDAEGLWDRAVPCTAGQAMCLRPSSEDQLAHVCLHFLVDRVRLFSRRALAQLADVAAILDTFADTLEWDTVTRDASTRGYTSALALALGAVAVVLDARPPDAVLSVLTEHSVCAPDVSDIVARRVIRHSSWTTLERLTSRQPTVRHLLPPNPKRWRPRLVGSRPPFGMLDGYARWMSASTWILLHPGEAAAERRFATQLESLVYPHGLPNANRSLWSRTLWR
jgi:hypothetical protein